MVSKPLIEFQHNSSLFESINNEVIIIDRNGKIVYCNKSACNMFKKKEDELIGMDFGMIFPLLKSQPADEKNGVAFSYEWKMEDQTFIVNQSLVYGKNELLGSIIIFQDITSIINNHAHVLKRSIDQYENALNELSECFLGVDRDGNIDFVSDGYAQFLGVKDRHSIIGRHCTEVIENTRMHIVLQTGQAEIGDLQQLNGQKIIVMRVPIFRDGEIAGAIGKIMFHDVRDLKSLASQINTMETKLNYYETELKRLQSTKYSFDNIIGSSKRINEVKNISMKVSRSRSTILIRGESGTGKELFAHAIHHASPRSEGPFIRLNCAAIPKELFEAELFGYEDGAFTGAKKGGKPGKIELAKNGTLFLDEIGDMPLDMQAKLLRVLQEKEIERIGGTKISQIDVRFIAATHQNLWEMIHQGKFREDLLYRLNVFTIDIPPLRERKEDISPVIEFMITKLNRELGTNVMGIDENVRNIFMEHDWPGNLRELENVLERSMNVIDKNIIQTEHLPLYLRNKQEKEADREGIGSLQMEVERAERRAIMKALKKASGKIQEAASLLGIHRASLYRKIEKYRILENLEKGE
ncbi:sigma 54-interacting transcriptional regulator [Ammoniphilus sp. 3BR4]|uniref:sigma 54-interacting transcriptional regulator n=1 Tax=Ammoniphilus sp. 3BR4 TaxID=3158265 RepID=UPI0034652BD4